MPPSGGKFSFRLCPRTTNLDDACFGSNFLVRADNRPQRDFWLLTGNDNTNYTMQVRLVHARSHPTRSPSGPLCCLGLSGALV